MAVRAVLGDQRGGWWRNQHLCIGYSPQNLLTAIAVTGILAHLLTTNRLHQACPCVASEGKHCWIKFDWVAAVFFQSLQDLPDVEAPLKNLRLLCLNENQLASVPGRCLSRMASLEVLKLADNALSDVPSDLARLTSLQVSSCRPPFAVDAHAVIEFSCRLWTGSPLDHSSRLQCGCCLWWVGGLRQTGGGHG